MGNYSKVPLSASYALNLTVIDASIVGSVIFRLEDAEAAFVQLTMSLYSAVKPDKFSQPAHAR